MKKESVWIGLAVKRKQRKRIDYYIDFRCGCGAKKRFDSDSPSPVGW